MDDECKAKWLDSKFNEFVKLIHELLADLEDKHNEPLKRNTLIDLVSKIKNYALNLYTISMNRKTITKLSLSSII